MLYSVNQGYMIARTDRNWDYYLASSQLDNAADILTGHTTVAVCCVRAYEGFPRAGPPPDRVGPAPTRLRLPTAFSLA